MAPPTKGDTERVETEKIRFVGKHSRDLRLSVYLQKRNVFETERDGVSACEPLGCIVRIADEEASHLKTKGQVVVVGVLARLICDMGFQYSSQVVFQLETIAQPNRNCSVFDFRTKFVTALPNENHIPFFIRMPTGMPPSVSLRHGNGGPVNWGLTYYVFAYITNAAAVKEVAEKTGVDGVWQKMRLGRRYSKVYMTFSLIKIPPIEKLLRGIPASTGVSRRKRLLGNGSPLVLEASLDKSAYLVGEKILINIRIRNTGKQRISGIKVTLKQLVTIKCGSEPRYFIKNAVKEYIGHEDFLKDAMEYDTQIEMNTTITPIDNINCQMAFESNLPKKVGQDPLLAPTSIFSGLSWNNSIFGIEKLRIFTVEYYINVHAVIPWASNVIVKLPFHLVSSSDNSGAPQSLNRTNSIGRVSLRQSVGGSLIDFDHDDNEYDIDDDDCSDSEINDSRQKNGHRLTISDDKPPDNCSLTTPSDDLKLAKSKLEGSRSRISEAHNRALSNQLDRRSLELVYGNRKANMIKDYLHQLHVILTQDFPRLSYNIGNKVGSTFALQSLTVNLLFLGVSHAELVPLGVSNSNIENRIEIFAQILDALELLFIKIERGQPDVIVEKMIYLVTDLIHDVPGYSILESSLRGLAKIIIQRGWATSKIYIEDITGNETYGYTELEGSNLLLLMAEQFQNLYHMNDSHEFLSEYSTYCRRLSTLFLSDLDEGLLSVVAFNHWHYLQILGVRYLTGEMRSPEGLLLFSELRGALKWDSSIEALVPAKLILGKLDLEESAHYVIQSMQRL